MGDIYPDPPRRRNVQLQKRRQPLPGVTSTATVVPAIGQPHRPNVTHPSYVAQTVPAASFGSVPRPARTPDGTPSELAGAAACATLPACSGPQCAGKIGSKLRLNRSPEPPSARSASGRLGCWELNWPSPDKCCRCEPGTARAPGGNVLMRRWLRAVFALPCQNPEWIHN